MKEQRQTKLEKLHTVISALDMRALDIHLMI